LEFTGFYFGMGIVDQAPLAEIEKQTKAAIDKSGEKEYPESNF
jgi:hypothetical protein